MSILRDPVRFFTSRYEKYGEVSWFGGFGRGAVLVFGPDGIEQILGNRDRVFSSERGWAPFVNPFFERGLLFMDFEEHLSHRRIMQQAFTRPRLIDYMHDMSPLIAQHISEWKASGTLPAHTTVNDMTLDVATSVFMGATNGADVQFLKKSFTECLGGTKSIVRADVPGGSWRRGLKARRALENYLHDKIPAKRTRQGRDLFSVLCTAESDEGERFTDADVVNHMIFFQLAAHETTTTAITMLVYYLAKYPEWQDRLRAEALALGKDQLDFADLDALPSFEWAFKETLRLASPVATAAREALVDTEIRGHFIPAGTLVLAALLGTHRIERWWPNPDIFDPERYAPERREDKRHRYIWAPFGGFAHKCIGMRFGGMEAKTALYHMLLRYSWTVPDGYEVPLNFSTGPVPADGLPIRLRRLP